MVSFHKGLVRSVGKGAAQPVRVLLLSSILLSSCVQAQSTSIYRTPIPKKKFVGRRGSGTKTRNAQCASAHVAMAAVV
jgi:hypothetical protein